MDSHTGWGTWPVIVIATVTLLILVPLCLVFVYAFATKWFANHWWWPQEMGTKWILSIFQTDNLINSLVNSYLLATLTTIATILITFPAAYVLGTRARASDRLAGELWSRICRTCRWPSRPSPSPWGLLPLYAALGLMATFGGIVLCHMIMAIPYALRAMVGSFPAGAPRNTRRPHAISGRRGST